MSHNRTVIVAVLEGDSIPYIGALKTPQGIVYADNRQAVFEIGIEKEGVNAPHWDMRALAPAGGIMT